METDLFHLPGPHETTPGIPHSADDNGIVFDIPDAGHTQHLSYQRALTQHSYPPVPHERHIPCDSVCKHIEHAIRTGP